MRIKKIKLLPAIMVFMITVMILSGCGGAKANIEGDKGDVKTGNLLEEQSSQKENKGKIVIGSIDSPEALVYAEIYAVALERDGYTVERVYDLDKENGHKALIEGKIDFYPEFTGTALISVLKEDPIIDPTSLYGEVAKKYKEKFNLLLLEPAPANHTLGIVASKAAAAELNLVYISDLQENAGKIIFASPGDFKGNPDGIPALNKAYGSFEFKEHKLLDGDSGFEALEKGEADAIVAYLTDGHIEEGKYVVLKDIANIWTPNNVVPVTRADVLEKYPDVRGVFNNITIRLNDKAIRSLNKKILIDGSKNNEVANEYLDSIK